MNAPRRALPVWRAVVADDDEDTRLLIAGTLRRAGFAVTEVCNGRDLLDALVPEPAGRTLIVSDIGMPEMDGIAVTAAVRRAGIRTPILLVTAFGDEKTVREALAAGADHVLAKPFELSRLRSLALELVFEAPLQALSDGRAASEHERQGGEDQEHDEQDLRDSCRAGGDAAKAEECGDERDDEENGGPVQHDGTPCFGGFGVDGMRRI